MSASLSMPFLIASLPIRAREPLDERVGDVADCDRDRDRHAALARRAVAGADERVDGLVEIRVGHHDEMVLRAAERLDALAVLRAVRVDVLGDRSRADEAHRRDVGMLEQRVDRLVIALHDIEHAGRQARALGELGEQQRRARIALARFEHERVPARDRDRKHPQRHHRREVERRDARAHAERLAQRPVVDAAADVVAVLSAQALRDAASELDDLDPALDLAARVGEHFAVLARDRGGERRLIRLDQIFELE